MEPYPVFHGRHDGEDCFRHVFSYGRGYVGCGGFFFLSVRQTKGVANSTSFTLQDKK